MSTRIAFAGLLDIPTAILLAVGLLVLAAWFAWRQWHGVSRGWNTFLWGLRAVAIVLLLGMLVGPTHITEHRTVTPQSIAVMVDSSDSMDVRDESDQPSLSRWQLVSTLTTDSTGTALQAADRASAALGIAERRCRTVAQSIEQLRSLDSIRGELAGITSAVNRCEERLRTLPGLVPDDLSRSVSRLTADLGSRLIDPLAAIDKRMADGEIRSASDLADPWKELTDDAGGLARRLSSVARRLADRLEIAADSSLSRRDHVIRALSRVSAAGSSVSDIAETSDPRIRRWQFAEQPHSLPEESSWESALRSSTDDVQLQSADASDSATDLSAALREIGETGAANGVRAVVLISDGGHNASTTQSPQEVASTLAEIPVYVVPIGRVDRRRDLEMYRVDAPTAVSEKDMILIDVIVTAWDCDGESTVVTLFQDGTEVERRTIELSAGQLDHRLTFEVKAEQPGRREFELTVDPVVDEVRTENNSTVTAVEVVKNKVRVLLSDRNARWEYRYLEQLFRRDTHVECDRLLFLPAIDATGRRAASNALPDDVDSWDEYDVVILGDLDTSQLTRQSQSALDDFVRKRGGNLVLIAGRESMPHRFQGQPVQELLPVLPGRSPSGRQAISVRSTPAGSMHSVMQVVDDRRESERIWVEQFESVPFYWMSEFSRARPTSEVLLTATEGKIQSGDDSKGDEGALLCWHRLGAGRVVYMAAPVSYNLRFRCGDRYHHRFWGQLLRWLTAPEMGGGTDYIRIVTDRMRYDAGESVGVTLNLKDLTGAPVRSAEVGVTARNKAGQETHLDLTAVKNAPGRYTGEFRGLAAGAYSIQPDGPAIEELLKATNVSVPPESLVSIERGGSVEQQDTRCNLLLLQQVAEVSGGQVIPPTAIEEVLALSSFDPKVTTRIEEEPLWNHWIPVCLALGCLIGDWGIRKRLGLV